MFSKATSQVSQLRPVVSPPHLRVCRKTSKIQAFVASGFLVTPVSEETGMDGKLFCYFNWDRIIRSSACTLLTQSCIVGDGMYTSLLGSLHKQLQFFITIPVLFITILLLKRRTKTHKRH
jgi:hypothetical protein